MDTPLGFGQFALCGIASFSAALTTPLRCLRSLTQQSQLASGTLRSFASLISLFGAFQFPVPLGNLCLRLLETLLRSFNAFLLRFQSLMNCLQTWSVIGDAFFEQICPSQRSQTYLGFRRQHQSLCLRTRYRISRMMRSRQPQPPKRSGEQTYHASLVAKLNIIVHVSKRCVGIGGAGI